MLFRNKNEASTIRTNEALYSMSLCLDSLQLRNSCSPWESTWAWPHFQKGLAWHLSVTQPDLELPSPCHPQVPPRSHAEEIPLFGTDSKASPASAQEGSTSSSPHPTNTHSLGGQRRAWRWRVGNVSSYELKSLLKHVACGLGHRSWALLSPNAGQRCRSLLSLHEKFSQEILGTGLFYYRCTHLLG